jgi:hypothetical protein
LRVAGAIDVPLYDIARRFHNEEHILATRGPLGDQHRGLRHPPPASKSTLATRTRRVARSLRVRPLGEEHTRLVAQSASNAATPG